MHRALVSRVAADLDALVAEVAVDVPGDTPPDELRGVVASFLDGLATAPRFSASDLRRIHAEGARAAREGVPLHAPIDRYLTTAWVVWNAAARNVKGGEEEALAALGAALLRAGDDIAAALADGYTAAERSLAARAGATRRAVLEEIVTLAPDDAAALARLGGRVALVGLQPGTPYQLIVVRGRSEMEDESPPVQQVAAILARAPSRRSHLVGVRGRELVVLLEHPWQPGATVAEALRPLPSPWWAVSTRATRLAELAAAYAAALDGLRVAELLDAAGRVVPVESIAIERALTADRDLARAGVAAWLGPLEGASRGGPALVHTLEAFFAAGESVAATARSLGVATRTVSYRLERIADLLGVDELDRDTRARLVTALLARRLLGTTWASPDDVPARGAAQGSDGPRRRGAAASGRRTRAVQRDPRC